MSSTVILLCLLIGFTAISAADAGLPSFFGRRRSASGLLRGCPDINPTLHKVNLTAGAGTFYTNERTHHLPESTFICNVAKTTVAPDGKSLNAELSSYLKWPRIPFPGTANISQVDAVHDPTLIKQVIHIASKEVVMFLRMIAGETTTDGVIWSASYNCTEDPKTGYANEAVYVSSTVPVLKPEVLVYIHDQLRKIGVRLDGLETVDQSCRRSHFRSSKSESA